MYVVLYCVVLYCVVLTMSGKTPEQEATDAAMAEFKKNIGLTKEEIKNGFFNKKGKVFTFEPTDNEQRLKAVAAFDKAHKDRTPSGYYDEKNKPLPLSRVMGKLLSEISPEDKFKTPESKFYIREYIKAPVSYEGQRLIDERKNISIEAAGQPKKYLFKADEVPTNGGKAKASKKRDKSKSGGRSHSRSKSKARSKSKSKSKARSKSKSKKGKT